MLVILGGLIMSVVSIFRHWMPRLRDKRVPEIFAMVSPAISMLGSTRKSALSAKQLHMFHVILVGHLLCRMRF